jgi:hypothetical protein
MRDPELRRSLALARDSGEAAARATRQIAMKNTDPDDSGTPWRQRLGGQFSASAGPPVGAGQVRSAGTSLREFSAELARVNALLAERGAAPVDDLGDASSQLSISMVDAAEVHNRVNDALASLERIRIAIVLDRPLDQST